MNIADEDYTFQDAFIEAKELDIPAQMTGLGLRLELSGKESIRCATPSAAREVLHQVRVTKERIKLFDENLVILHDAHFAGSAKTLWQEINEKGKFNIDMEAPDTDEIVIALIAKYAYAVAIHTVRSIPGMPKYPPERLIDECVPDLMGRPVEPNETQP